MPTLTLDGLNLNSGTTYTLMPGIDFGAQVKTFEEYRSYTGAVTQANVNTGHYIPVSIPLMVQGSSLATLDAAVQAINAKIDTCSAAATKALVWNGTDTYQIASSQRVAYTLDQQAGIAFRVFIVVALNREP